MSKDLRLLGRITSVIGIFLFVAVGLVWMYLSYFGGTVIFELLFVATIAPILLCLIGVMIQLQGGTENGNNQRSK